MNTSQTSTAEGIDDTPYSLRGLPLVGVVVALFLALLMAALDGTIVDTATPRIIGDLHGFSLYSWLVTVYLLASTTTIPLAGKLSDLLGRKWFLIGGVIVFLIGSALAGTSQTMVQLIIFRGVQGLGSGVLQTLALVLIADLFPPKERARWLGTFSAVIILASIIGPLAGGWITDHLGWRWIFYINIPLGLSALILFIVWLPTTLSMGTPLQLSWATLRQIDVAGAATIVVGTICLLLGLTWGGQTYPWTSSLIIGLFVATVLLFLLFFYVETHVQEPILPLDLFKSQVFSAGALLSLLLGMVLFSIIVYLPLFVQAVQGQSPTSSGAIMTPLTFTIAILSIITGSVVSKIGRYQIIAIVGAIILAGGVFLMTQLNATTSSLEITLDVFLIGVGLGILMPLVNVATQNVLPKNRLGVGTGAVTFLRSTGSTMATAVLGTIVSTISQGEINVHLSAAAHRFPDAYLRAATEKQILTSAAYRHTIVQQGISIAVKQANVPVGSQHNTLVSSITQHTMLLLNAVFEVVRRALEMGIHQSFQVAFYLCLVIIGVTLFLKDTPTTQGEEAKQRGMMDAPTGTYVPIEEKEDRKKKKILTKRS